MLTRPFDIGSRLQPNEKMTGKARWQSDVGAGAAKIGEYIGRRRERANAVRDRADRDRQAANLSRGADAGHTEPFIVGSIDCHCSRSSQTLGGPFHDIPGRQSAGGDVGSNDDDRSHRSIGQAPSGKSDHSRNDFGDALNRQQTVSHTGVEKREVLEVFRSARNDPEIGGCMIDHGCDHAAEAEV